MSVIRSVLFAKTCTVKFPNIQYSFKTSDELLIHLLTVERFAQVFKKESDKIKISFDTQNMFYISANTLTKTDKRLVHLLATGIVYGAVFLDKKHEPKIKFSKTVKIIQDDRPIIVTSEGIKFYLDSIGPDTIVETYIRRIHDEYSYDINDKIIIDAGASFGDTPLYFASKGAKIYAFEMVQANYNQLEDNLKLNSNLAQKITAVHAAVGKDGKLQYDENPQSDNYEGGASFVINKYGTNTIKREVIGISVKSIIEKFNLPDVYLLKLDCKGCEYYLTKEDLQNVHRVKIEYYVYLKSHKLSNLIDLFNSCKYNLIIFKNTPDDLGTIKNRGNILAEKIQY